MSANNFSQKHIKSMKFSCEFTGYWKWWSRGAALPLVSRRWQCFEKQIKSRTYMSSTNFLLIQLFPWLVVIYVICLELMGNEEIR